MHTHARPETVDTNTDTDTYTNIATATAKAIATATAKARARGRGKGGHMWHEDTSVVSKYAASLRLLKCNYAGNMLVAISDYDNEIIHSASGRRGSRR